MTSPLTILGKDLRILSRRRGLLAVLLLYPIVTVGVLGVGFQAQDPTVRVAWVNEDTDVGQVRIDGENVTVGTMRDRLDRAVDLVEADSRSEARDMLRRGEVDAVVVIPPHFLNDVQSLTASTSITIIVDRSDPVRAQIANDVIRGVGQQFVERFIRFKMDAILGRIDVALEGNVTLPGVGEVGGLRTTIQDLERIRDEANLTEAQRERLDEDIAFLRVAVTVLDDSSTYLRATALPVEVHQQGLTADRLGSRDVLAPLTVALSVFWTATLAGASVLGFENQQGLLDRLLQTPVRVASVVAGKAGAVVAIVAAQTAVLLAVAVGVFGVAAANLPLTYAVVLLASLAMGALGMLLAAFADGVEDAVLLAIFVGFPMFLVSGVVFPVDFMPEPIRTIAGLLPSTVAVDALRGAMLRAESLTSLAPDMLYLVGAAVAALVPTGILLGRRRR